MNYGRYQIIKELGKGSMGVVYQAHDPNLDVFVALKVLRQDRVVSEAFVRRFLSEGKALGRLDCANIVRVYNVDEASGTVYIVMEFIEGESLNEVMKKKRLSPEEIINIGVIVAETLDYAHQKGIVHRDIKPSNILIRSDGLLKITDFGIAHIEDAYASEQTQAGEILGTPAYMSPEQVMSRPVDGRSDLFSLGIILYELCTGIRPFGGENLAAIFKAITQDEPARITSINPSIPQDLARVIMKCLKKNPDARFESGNALSEALNGCLKKKEPETRGVSAQVSAQKKSKNIGFILSLVIILIIMTGGVAYYVASHKTKSTAVEEVRSAYLNIESFPVGAQVFIDNMFKGKTPLKIGLPMGKHEVRLTMPDYHDWEAQVELKEEGETPLSVRLSPSG
jgi:serine/threonine protein kinase